MPLYEFTNEQHGLSVTVPFPVSDRPNSITLPRAAVPSSITVGVGARPPTEGDKIAQAYKHVEQAGGLARGGNYLSTAAVKRAIAMPDHDPATS